MVGKRLSRGDWLDAALAALARQGHRQIGVEPLARRLGVSRGSFYWHFADVAEYERAILERWEDLSVDAPYLRAREKAPEADSETLRALIAEVFRAPKRLERAVRNWSASSPVAAQAVTRVDTRRLKLLSDLFQSADDPNEGYHPKAVILYWCYIGYLTSNDEATGDAVLEAMAKLFTPD